MKIKILYIERKFWRFVSIEKVFRQIAKKLPDNKFEYSFEKLKYPNSLVGLVKNLLLFKNSDADILHITGHIHYIALKLPKSTTILTIHDLGFLHNNKGLKRYILKKLYLDLPIKKLKYVTTISEATKKEIVLHTNCDKNKIKVIENPLPEEFLNTKKSKFNTNCPTILQIGTTPNKNLLNLINALKGIVCVLDIVGKLDQTLLNILAENKVNYINSYELDNVEIVKKYGQADIVSFCSTFEGFGLPIIEAQATQTAVITSDLSPMKEVAGEGALLVNPLKINEIKRGIKKLIKDSEFRENLIAKGLENVKRFDSNYISKEYASLYHKVLSNL